MALNGRGDVRAPVGCVGVQMMHDAILRMKRGEVLRIMERHGASAVRVLVPETQGTGVNDASFIFVVATGPDTSPWFPAGLLTELEQLLGRAVYVLCEDALHWHVRDRILSEATPL